MSGTQTKKELTPEQREGLLRTLKARFENNMKRHKGLEWEKVLAKLEHDRNSNRDEKLWSLNEMERTGGEPDVVGYDNKTGEYIFYDCSRKVLKAAEAFVTTAKDWSQEKNTNRKTALLIWLLHMGIELLTEEQYRELQKLGNFDTKTSSWVKTPSEIRKLGGAIFADFRYGNVFIYHNGAESYYGSRAFRGSLRV